MTPVRPTDTRPDAPAASGTRRRGRRGASRRSGPPRGVRSGYPWWAYALLAVVAVATLALVAAALLHDYTGVAAALR